MRIPDAPAHAQAIGARLLLADDDHGVRRLFATLLRATAGVTSVIEAEDGAEAVKLARERRLDIAVLDLNMPRLNGIEAPLRLRALQPWLQIALHSSDPVLLRQRAAGLELPLFDKVDFDGLLAWAELQAKEACADDGNAPIAPMTPKRDLFCSLCGYGIVSRTPLPRCPMCGGEAAWDEPLGWTSRRAALHERLAS
jgi:CheY-like chemotaxis protein